jgi:putrescine transport system substrate-binding protein
MVTIAAVLAMPSFAAKAQQRTVNFYNWSNYIAPGVLEDFTKETGIKVVYDTFDANETLETRLLAGKSGYDVVVPTAYFLQRQITGIGYNVKAVQKILGTDASIDSWDIVFKPENLAKFRECGVHMLDSADDILPAALNYLGLDPNSTKQADLEKAADVVSQIRPYVRKFHSSEYLSALATGEICLVVGWSGDIMQARSRASEAKSDVEIGYAIPKQGAQMFFDNLAIPADAKNVSEAYELINYLYRPEVAAKNSDFLSYANGNLASQKLVDPKILDDKTIYPDDATLGKLFVITARDPATQRVINRLWTRVKTGR